MGFFNDRKYGFIGPKRKKGKDFYEVAQAIRAMPGSVLPGVTPGVDQTAFTESANRQFGPTLEASYADAARFRDEYYLPLFDAFVEDPIRGMMGEGDLASMDRFQSAQDAVSALGLAEDQANALLQAAGSDSIFLKEDNAALREMGIGLEKAEKAFEEEEASIEEGLIGAEDVKRESMMENRVARQRLMADVLPEYEKSRAGLATSGLAYSGPAMSVVEASDEARAMDLGDISRDSAQVMKDFRDTREILEGKRTLAEETLDLDRQLFSTKLSGLLDNTQGAASQMLAEAGSLLPKFRQYGETTKGFADEVLGKKYYGGGVEGTGYFQETGSQSDALTDLTSMTNLAQSSADRLKDALLNPNFFMSEGDDV